MSSPKAAPITFLSHGTTAAMRAGRFPTPDDALDAAGREVLRRLSFRPNPRHRCLTSPARRAVETAAALGVPAQIDPLLDDADPGRWAGQTIADVAAAEPDHLAAWLNGTDAAPHGGEASQAVAARVSRWLDAQADGVLAITHAAIIRSAVAVALQVPPSAATRIDIAPLGLTRLSGAPGRWRLACLNLPLAKSAPDDGALLPGLR